MTGEERPQSPLERLQNATTPEASQEALIDAILAGEVRTEITCEEARQEWFVSARGFYLEGAAPRAPIDAEVGLHLSGCYTRECGLLANAYFIVLKRATPGVEDLASFLDSLESQVASMTQEGEAPQN